MSLPHNPAENPLFLAQQLTTKTETLCLGLEDGKADILELVTPTTAKLLNWWFGQEAIDSRNGFKFHCGQKQAILNIIVAHEIEGCQSLQHLYQRVAPDALLVANCLADVSQTKHNHPKYCLKMATGTGKTWVLQALMVWQLLNKNANPEDARFTRQFMVVAPGLIVYDRLLDAFLGKEMNGERVFDTSDMKQNAALFIPEDDRETIFAFVRGNVCKKEEIGLKTTANGMIAITNWHLLSEVEELDDDEEMLIADGQVLPAEQVVSAVLPLTPGKASGNALDTLDRRYARGNVLDYLANLPDLMVFNDEAHHIHEVKKEGETTEVEWQKSLMRIAETKQHRFVQVDFSATPYNDVGSGKHKKKVYFPHIIVDFDLKTAMKKGLVKSLVLDKRKAIGALPLEFKAERDEQGNPILSEGQIIMLRAGLQKLNKLATDFATIDPKRYPKMLVVCEDTTVSPLVAKFMQDEGLSKDEVMTIDSSKKGELKGDWASYKELLFDVDRHQQPKVIVSVLMLREGFDVNNICVIVPLRSSQAQILLEQTIGRGLRLMWRDPEYTDSKRENRALIGQGKEPSSMIDVLSIVEHPAFNQFYAELIAEGLAGEDTGENTGGSAGDLIKVELVEDYSQYDFAVPFIVQEAEETIAHNPIDINTLIPFTSMDKTALKAMLGKGDMFVSQDLQAGTLFGDYRVQGAVMQVSGYNEYLSRITRRIGQALSTPLKGGNKIATHQAMPYLQVAQPVLSEWIDDYIHERFFNESFEPLEDENWRLLMLQPVIDHITQIFAEALIAAENRPLLGKTEVSWRHLSEVNNLVMRESNSLDVTKCIYPKLSYPNKSGGLEKSFIQWAQCDASIDAFCKISETKHTFVQLRYLKVDSIPGFYSPDFFVRCGKTIYLVETKGQQQMIDPNVQRKLKSAVHWCERINQLPEDDRNGLNWHYVLLGQKTYEDWQQKGARLGELLDFARVRNQGAVELQSRLF